jgi:hypothetical protein
MLEAYATTDPYAMNLVPGATLKVGTESDISVAAAVAVVAVAVIVTASLELVVNRVCSAVIVTEAETQTVVACVLGDD